MSEREIEKSHGGPRERAVEEIGDVAMLASWVQDAPDLAEIARFYQGQEEGMSKAALTPAESVVGAELSSSTDMVAMLEDFLTSPNQAPTVTLARQRMHGRWDQALRIEEQIPVLSYMLSQLGYHVETVDRFSSAAKIVTTIVPDLTRVHDYTGAKRSRLMLRAVNESLHEDHPLGVLEMDKIAYFALHIGALDKVSGAGAQEVRMVIIDTMLRGLPLDFAALEKNEAAATLDDLSGYLNADATGEDRARLLRAVDRTRRYGIPDHLIIGRLVHAIHPQRLWSPLSTKYVERFISASTPGLPWVQDPSVIQAAPDLLSPAAVVYYAASYSHLEARRRARPDRFDVRNLAGYAIQNMGPDYVPMDLG